MAEGAARGADVRVPAAEVCREFSNTTPLGLRRPTVRNNLHLGWLAIEWLA